MKDWELLRDELVAQDHAKYAAEKDELSLLLDDSPKSPYADIDSEEKLAQMIEDWYPVLINEKRVTEETIEKYADFFDRTGLEKDLEKVMADKRAEIQWEQSFPEGKSPTPPGEARKNLCREYRRNIGAQLKAMREKRGYTLRYVEEETGVAKNIISRTEAGRANTTIDTLAILVDFYAIGLPLEVSCHTSLEAIEKLNPEPKYDFGQELRSIPEEDAMYQSTDHGVRISGYVHGMLEDTFLREKDPRVSKYSGLPKYEWYGYIDGRLYRCTRWPDQKIRPFISTDTDPRFKELIQELKATEAPHIGKELDKTLFDHVHDEIILGGILKHKKAILEEYGILTEAFKDKYKYYLARMEKIDYKSRIIRMF